MKIYWVGDSVNIAKIKATMRRITRNTKPAFGPSASFARFSALIVSAAMIAAASYSASSASSPLGLGGGFAKSASSLNSGVTGNAGTAARPFSALAVEPLPGPESIATYAADCVTPKTDFNLSDTVCAKLTGGSLGPPVQEAINWAGPFRLIASSTDVVTDPQTSLFTLPATATSVVNGNVVDNRGIWSVSGTNIAEAYLQTRALFTVHDTAQAVADLVVYTSMSIADSDASVGGDNASGNLTTNLYVANRGPDAASNVQAAETVPVGTTFLSLTQVSGPTFSCTKPAVGDTGTINCTIPSLAKGEVSIFTLVYHIGAATPDTSISGAASSSTADRDTSDNASTPTAPIGTGPGSGGGTCTLTCPSNVVQNNDQNQQGAIVNYVAPSPTGTCGTVSCDPPSGSFFPIGVTQVSCSDGTGGTCSFTVTISDASQITITLISPNPNANPPVPPSPIAVECHTTFTDPGATATNGAGTSFTVTSQVTCPNGLSCSQVDVNALGTYTITYTATDGTNTATATRTVIVGDTTPPTIALIGANPMTVECHTSFTDPGATANDTCTGSFAATATGTVDANTPGTYTITYNASDSSGNDAAQITRTVNVVDTTPPTITLNGANPMTVECHTSFTDPGATATDACVGSVAVTTSGSVNVNAPGAYTITYTANDGARTATATRAVNVVDTTPPTMTLNGANPITVECHTSFTDPGATATDTCAGSVAVTASGGVSVNTPGTYTITYAASDGTNSASRTRTVNVVDTTPPTISCPASIVVTLPLNSTATSMAVSYPAVTGTDTCSGVTITSTPASGSVFPVGATTVTATATDASGHSTSCSFTVTVLFNFTGFFSPVGNPPTLNTVNAGRAIPVKFSLSGNKGLSIFASDYPVSGEIACDASAPPSEVTETVTAGGSSLSYDSGQYNYVWKTDASWAGTCRQLQVKLSDGTVHVANFKFR